MRSPTPAPIVIDVSDLVEQPGATRPVNLAVPPPDGLELPLATVAGDVQVDGVLESLVDGILCRGTVAATVRLACSRCLEPLTDDLRTDVAELYGDAGAPAPDRAPPEEGFAVDGGLIDLDPLLRDVVAAAVPLQPLCRDDCAGLCAQCGIDLNRAACDCRSETHDPRWAALRGLRLPPDPDDTAEDGTADVAIQASGQRPIS